MTDLKAITDAVWAARGPSLWTKPDPSKSRQQQASELAYDSGRQPEHKGAEPVLAKRREYDTQAMLDMHLAGSTWREIGRRFDCCANTAQKATEQAFPHRVERLRRDPKPASQIVLRTKADAAKTARIQGTGVAA